MVRASNWIGLSLAAIGFYSLRVWVNIGLAVFLVFLVIFLSVLQLADHYGFRTQLHDLGIMEQAIWQITQGRLDMPNSYPEIGLSRLARHRNLIFYLVAPLYAVVSHTELLLLLTPVALASACILIFHLGRRMHLGRLIPLTFAVFLGMDPFVQNLMLFDFRADIFAVPLLIALVYTVRLRWTPAFIVVLSCLLMVKEDLSFTVLALTPWIAWRWSMKTGIFVTVMVVVYWIVVWRSLPEWMGFPPGSPFWFRFSYLGSSPEEAIRNIVADPKIVLAQLSKPCPSTYLATMLIHGGFLGLFSPLILLGALPALLINALDQTSGQHTLSAVYYSGIPSTVISLAALHGLAWLRVKSKIASGWFYTVFLIQAVFYAVSFSSTPFNPQVSWSDYFIDKYAYNSFVSISKLIPKKASIATQNNLGPHLSKRDVVVELSLPTNQLPVEYILLGIHAPLLRNNPLTDHHLSMLLGFNPNKFLEIAQDLLNSREFGLVRQEGPFLLFRRGHAPDEYDGVRTFLEQAAARFASIPTAPCLVQNCSLPGVELIKRLKEHAWPLRGSGR